MPASQHACSTPAFGVTDGPAPEHFRIAMAVRLEPLDAAAAAELIDASPVALARAARVDPLNEAACNPLALIELPIAAAASTQQPFVTGVVPLTERLERAFAVRMLELGADARAALLVTALNDGTASPRSSRRPSW